MPEFRKIDDRGRVTLPGKYLKDLGLKPGDAVQIFKSSNHILIYRAAQAEAAWVRRAAHG